MFEGFGEVRFKASGAEIFARIGGSGPALLMLHGYPQTSAMWAKITRHLTHRHTLVCPDLRGYGASSKPPAGTHSEAYSKREMARDQMELMAHLGFDRFGLVGHDRGGRVAHRLALDWPERVRRLTVLDIAPTREMYRATTEAFARAYWHWFYLILPAPIPETGIGADPEGFWRRKCGAGSAGMKPFSEAALAEYLAAFRDPETIRATCDDYRAAAGIDIEHDDADGGAKLTMPLLALWGAHGVIERCFDCLALWRERAADVRGEALPCGHYMAEEAPEAVAARLLAFLGG